MKKWIYLSAFAMVMPLTDLFAHTINYQLDKPNGGVVFTKYIGTGFQHIIPSGLDHILFILCVFFLSTNIRQIILQASMFTVAHSITLGLAMYGIIHPPGNIIEPLIAASIVFLALENLYAKRIRPWRMLMVFLFGLVHGMGFAGALSNLGLPKQSFAVALIGFNVGVELGQVTIIGIMYFLVARPYAQRTWYRPKLVMPACLLIALIAGYWTIERLFFV